MKRALASGKFWTMIVAAVGALVPVACAALALFNLPPDRAAQLQTAIVTLGATVSGFIAALGAVVVYVSGQEDRAKIEAGETPAPPDRSGAGGGG